MNALKRLFGGINMTWPKVIIFSIVVAIYTALINQVPQLLNTSFRDLAITLEAWIFFAMIIMMNAKSPLDSALKTFVFFLISQPLIYLIEVPFLGWQIMAYYKNWIFLTILTFPMAFVGYYIKKGNKISLLILIPAILFLIYSSVSYFNIALYSFPNHLLSAIFCLVLPIVFVLVLLKDKKLKMTGLGMIAIVLIAGIIYSINNPYVYKINGFRISGTELYFDETYNVYLEDESIGEVSLGNTIIGDSEYNSIDAVFKKAGKNKLFIESPDGYTRVYDLDIGINTYDKEEIISSEYKKPIQLIECNVSHDEKYGGVYVNSSIEEFNNLGFEFGDSISAVFSNDFIMKDIPYYNGYYVNSGEALLIGYPEHEYIKLSFNNGDDLWNTANIDENTTCSIFLIKKAKYKDTQDLKNNKNSDIQGDTKDI